MRSFCATLYIPKQNIIDDTKAGPSYKKEMCLLQLLEIRNKHTSDEVLRQYLVVILHELNDDSNVV